MTDDLPGTALVIRPGDHVLIGLDRDVPAEAVANMIEQLRARFPGVEFTVMAGISGMAVRAHATA